MYKVSCLSLGSVAVRVDRTNDEMVNQGSSLKSAKRSFAEDGAF